MAGRERDRPRVGLIRLDEHSTRRVAAAPPGELGDELERALLGPEVRQREPGVGVDDRGERDALEVVPLGDHLGAEQHAALALAEARSSASERRAGCADRVRVEPDEIELGQAGRELLLEPLGSGPEPRELDGAARRAALGLLRREAAVVAVEAPVGVQRQRDVAALAAEREPAGAGSESPARRRAG